MTQPDSKQAPGLLENINGPDDVRALKTDALPELAAEIRKLIIETVSKTGGHLAPNLGTVELTIALLRVFNPPQDRILWDVGHQAYAYKILTGRRDRFHTLRRLDGLSGFPRRDESPCDAFGVGHAGTAISAALGMAVARDKRGGNEHVVAVVGDGALSCGTSYEALNNAALATRRLVLVINDNKMSISANVGAMSRYLARLLTDPRYNRWKRAIEQFAKDRLRLGRLRRLYFRLSETVKSLFLRSVIMEEMGFRYIGPVDGHDIASLSAAFETARDSDEPIVLHVSTQKGKGYPFAEDEPEAWHGTGCFETATGQPAAVVNAPRYSVVFGRALERLAQDDKRVVAVTAAMTSGTGLSLFARLYPDRFFDVGICEEHAMVFAAGMACEGLRPVVAMYSTFSQRVVDYVIHDICLQNLPVTLCLDRAGVVGDDGPTHQGVFDVALFRAVPNLTIMQPGNEAELGHMLYSALRRSGPVIIRYPRGVGPGTPLPDVFEELPEGRAVVLRDGADVAIWAVGDFIGIAMEVAERLHEHGIAAGVVNPRYIKPLDVDLLATHARSVRVVAAMENGAVRGGFGSQLGEELHALRFSGRFLSYGWPDAFIPQGRPDELRVRHGLTAPAIADSIRQAFEA